MIPYKSIIQLDKTKKQSVYIQLSNQLITLIKTNVLKPKAILPSSRSLAETLEIHRKTVIAAYDELLMQGWIITVPKKGTFVNAEIPVLQQKNYLDVNNTIDKKKTGFTYYKNECLREKGTVLDQNYLYLNDGISDVRLTPLKDLALIYRNISHKKHTLSFISYTSTYGHNDLRTTLVNYLNNTRGLNITVDNILITRGSQMGIYLAAALLLKTKDKIAVGSTNYISADSTFKLNEAQIIRIKVDDKGIDTNDLEKICKKHTIKAVYVTPHHHHPTTFTLSAERRLHLLNLAQEYSFAVIEDDYDYDFHYNYAPILPLASHDINGNVIYIGSVCKTVAPVYRVGYLIAAKEFVDEAAKLRGYIDRQGDALLELTFSKFIKNGDLDRHINKMLKIYKERRNLFCKLLKDELGEYFTFNIPQGGMAVWVCLDKKYNWEEIRTIALQEKLVVPDWKWYDAINAKHNCIRMGFATYNKDEMLKLVKRLKITLEKAKTNFKAL